ncbi:hypothetical protein CATMQ487_16940 [Sphaerotilus microaerophilus]|uniref:Uncharacterized protein n=2 Tax=Sphaerotilus microaerophilus TaxID=2914710 RepID=A0ABM7YK29_9BURK|nr:hypothetical protein CATMQ487_16940 [Sphaerotilus sp. FB-5]
MLRTLWQQASAPRHFVQGAATALARLDRIDAAWRRSAPMREVPLGALLASPLGASQLPLGLAAAQALQALAGPAAQDEADPTTPVRARRQATAPAAGSAPTSTARQPVPPTRAAQAETAGARRRGPTPPRPAVGPQGPISAAVAAATWAQRVAAAGLGQAMAQVVQRPALASPLATGLGTALAQASQPPWGTAIAQALRDAGIAAPPTPRTTPMPRGTGARRGPRVSPAGDTPSAGAHDADAAAAGQTGFAGAGQAMLDAIQRLPSQRPSGASPLPRRRTAPAPHDDLSTARGLGQALAGAGQAVAGALGATLAQVPGAASLAPALSTGLRGLAARAAQASAAPAATLVPATASAGSGRPSAADAGTAASPPPVAAALDDDDLTQRLTRVLQREARRDGIDLDDLQS